MKGPYTSIYTRKELEEQVQGVQGMQTRFDGLQTIVEGHQNVLQGHQTVLQGHQNSLTIIEQKISGVQGGMQSAGQFNATLWGQTFTNSTKTIDGDLTSKGKITGTQGNFSGPVSGTNITASGKVKGNQGEFPSIVGDTVFTGHVTHGSTVSESSQFFKNPSSITVNSNIRYHDVEVNSGVKFNLSGTKDMKSGQEVYFLIRNVNSNQISLQFDGAQSTTYYGGDISGGYITLDSGAIVEVSIIKLVNGSTAKYYVRAAQ